MLNAPAGVVTKQICFEDFKEDPKGSLTEVYTSTEPFKQWIEQTGGNVIPQEVVSYVLVSLREELSRMTRVVSYVLVSLPVHTSPDPFKQWGGLE